VIRELGEAIGESVVESVGRAVGRTQERRPLPVDLLENDDAYLAVFDAPGARHSDIQVRFEGGEVLVRIDRFREFHEGYEMRFPGRGLSLDGHVELPGAVDPAGASATLKTDGTLQVRVPKVESAASEHGVSVDVDDGETGGDADGDEGTGR
jgi:HSP20 family protein